VEETPPRRRWLWQQPQVAWLLFWLYGIPVAGNLNIILSIITVFGQVPAGTSIRPMGLACYGGMIGIGSAAVGGFLSVLTIVMWRKVPLLLWSGIASFILSFTPLLASIYFFRWYAAYKGLILSD
jgi:hypothetical protein